MLNYTICLFSTAPSPPLLTAVTAINSTSVNVQWSIPTELNGVLATYTIVYNAENDPEKTVTVVFNGELVRSMVSNSYVIFSILLDTILHHHWITSLPSDQCHHHCY